MNSIGLCMIVKDESHVIEETLKNLCEKISFDYWVVSDTGSSDGTQDIIKNFFKSKNIPGELHQDEWKDFGHNRSLALEYAFSSPSEYFLMFDADDRLVGNFVLPDLNKIKHKTLPTMFSLRIGKDFTYSRPLIYANDYKWKFVGVLHEYVDTVDEMEKFGFYIDGDYYIDSRREGNRSKDPEKYLKDAKILEAAYKKELETNGKLTARYAFYCAQSYKDCGMLEKSIEMYMIRATLGSYDEEVYLSYLYAGKMMIALQKPENEIEETLLKGWEKMRDRSECLFYLAHYFRLKNNFTKGYMYAKMGTKIPFPNHRQLFLEKDIFDWKIFDECAVSAFYTQRYDECFKLNAKILQRRYDERLVQNMNFCVPHLRQKAIKYNPYNFKKPQQRIYGVTLTMTSCKRFDLFEQTVNSLINNVKDLYMVERFICIDDNSSKEDRIKMLDKYPFIEFQFKRTDQKGHVFSMNLIRKKLTDQDRFVFHLEDDFVFLTRRNYIGRSLQVLRDNPQVGQVLFNRNYAETINEYAIQGGKPFGNGKFLVHEHRDKKQNTISCEYWPHFSFRPSIIRKEVFDKVGVFNSVPHFEMDYAKRYTSLGYISVFHNRVDTLHIGKLTSEKGDNAYSLNDVKQF